MNLLSAYQTGNLRKLFYLAVLLLLVGFFSACQEVKIIKLPSVKIITLPKNKNIKPPKKYDEIFDNLKLVLKKSVDSDLDLNIPDLYRQREKLIDQLIILKSIGPKTTPKLFTSNSQKIAYWLNTRAAWSVYLAYLESEKTKNKRTTEFYNTQIIIDKQKMSLQKIDNKLEKIGGIFAVLAAPGVCSNRAAVPQKIISSSNLPEKLKLRFCKFINDSDKIVIDVKNRTVEFPPIIWKYRKFIIQQFEINYKTSEVDLTTALAPFVCGSATHKLQNAVGYKCVENKSKVKLMIAE